MILFGTLGDKRRECLPIGELIDFNVPGEDLFDIVAFVHCHVGGSTDTGYNENISTDEFTCLLFTLDTFLIISYFLHY